MNYYDLRVDAPFPERDIPAPEQLKTKEDMLQLMHHILAEYRLSFNLYYERHGFAARQQMLSALAGLLGKQIPEQHPEYLENYPDSMPEIDAQVCLMLMVLERRNNKKEG